jgi:hypothetical protein
MVKGPVKTRRPRFFTQSGPEADVQEQSGYAVTTAVRKIMISDLILNVLGEIAAKRYVVIRNALWVVAAVFIICVTYGAIAS